MKNSDKIKLNIFGLPVLSSLLELSEETHISTSTLYLLSRHSNRFYFTYNIVKKSGKLRRICQPSKKLKGIQSWILVEILNKLKVSDSCKGFEIGSSTADNAKVHLGANALLTLDLEDFFHSIRRTQVYSVFKSLGYNSQISTILTNLCTYDGVLPQGGPCSPRLANLCCWALDLRISGYAGRRGIAYSRYADDLSLSGNNREAVVKVLPMITRIISEENFTVNQDKTRISGTSRAKRITGLVLSDDNYGIGKKQSRILRSKIHHLTLPLEQGNVRLIREVKGWLAYLHSVDKRRLLKVRKYIESLKTKYPFSQITMI